MSEKVYPFAKGYLKLSIKGASVRFVSLSGESNDAVFSLDNPCGTLDDLLLDVSFIDDTTHPHQHRWIGKNCASLQRL